MSPAPTSLGMQLALPQVALKQGFLVKHNTQLRCGAPLTRVVTLCDLSRTWGCGHVYACVGSLRAILHAGDLGDDERGSLCVFPRIGRPGPRSPHCGSA
jgi:hypothetical protein